MSTTVRDVPIIQRSSLSKGFEECDETIMLVNNSVAVRKQRVLGEGHTGQLLFKINQNE